MNYKLGNEVAPFHPSASHVEPAYRDGWNDCYKHLLAWREIAERLEETSDHKYDCQVYTSVQLPCSCGYSEACKALFTAQEKARGE